MKSKGKIDIKTEGGMGKKKVESEYRGGCSSNRKQMHWDPFNKCAGPIAVIV